MENLHPDLAILEAGERVEAWGLWHLAQPIHLRLSPQVVVMEEEPVAEKLVGPEPETFWKPRGGLWTSTLNDEGGEWLRWLIGEGYTLDMPRWGGKLWRLVPAEAKVYVVASPKQLYELVEKYPHPEREKHKTITSFRTLVDWPAMAEEWDAVHIPNPWPWRWHTDMAASMFFYSMDAESTCWFRWCFEGDPEELNPEPFLTNLKKGDDE